MPGTCGSWGWNWASPRDPNTDLRSLRLTLTNTKVKQKRESMSILHTFNESQPLSSQAKTNKPLPNHFDETKEELQEAQSTKNESKRWKDSSVLALDLCGVTLQYIGDRKILTGPDHIRSENMQVWSSSIMGLSPIAERQEVRSKEPSTFLSANPSLIPHSHYRRYHLQ